MDYTQFMSYDTLNQTQADMIIAMIKHAADDHTPELKAYTDEKLDGIEAKLHCKLSDDLKWFLKNVGEGYCPHGYFFKMDNEFNTNVNLESTNPLDWMLTVMHFGCTFFGVIMLKGDYAGKFCIMCTDEEYDDSDTDVDSMSDDEFEEYEMGVMLNAIKNPRFFPWTDFVKWYKTQLIQCIRDKTLA